MRIRLETACGCCRYEEWNGKGMPRTIERMLMRRPRDLRGQVLDEYICDRRVFAYQGREATGDCVVYREVLD